MRRFYMRMVLFVLLVCFCIFFGVDIASRGMERIQGPQPAAVSSGAVKTAAPTARPAASAIGAAVQPAAPKPEPVRAEQDEALNFVGNKLGDLLQIAAHHTIRLVVSLFGSLIG